MTHALFKFSDRITAIPVIHGSGDFAVEIRRIMLSEKFDCLAVPLPPSFKHDVEKDIEALPLISMVGQREPAEFAMESDGEATMNFVPIDPCQPIIAAVRVAIGERMRREFIDLEVEHFQAYSGGFPDPVADGTVHDDDTFALGGVTGKVTLGVAGPSPQWNVKAVMASARR